MKIFLTIWFGQFVSRIGTAMTRFAWLIWAYEQTGSAMTVAWLGFSSYVPFLVVSPFAGVWVDRVDRRKIMLFADLGAGFMTAGLLLLFITGHLQIWYLYLAEGLAGAFEAFQFPAYTAATTVLLPKDHYARASGLRSMASYGAQIIAPFLAALLLLPLGIAGVMSIDIATFLVAVLTLLIVRIPRVIADADESARQIREPFWQEMRVGFRYIWARPGLLGLTLIFLGMNFFASLTYFSILPAMILARSGNNEMALASVQAALGSAGAIGSLVLTTAGGPRRKIHGVLAGAALSFLFGDFLFAVGRDVTVWVIAACAAAFFIPFIIGNDLAIWQAKVTPAVQGRVFSVNDMLRQTSMPVGYLLGGIIADRWLEPAMLPGAKLVSAFGSLVGTGAGTGMAVMFLGTATLGCIMSLLGYLFRSIRCVEGDLPNHDLVTVARARQVNYPTTIQNGL